MGVPKQDYRTRFGRHIQALREETGLSQEALAAKAKLSRHYISELESGKRNPSLDVLMRLAKGLKVTLAELVGFE